MRRILAACGFVLLASVQIASAQSLNLKQVTTCSVGNFSTPFLTVDPTGTLCTTSSGGGGGTSSTFGAAFPATGTAAGFSDGTNMVAGRATSGALSSAFTPPTSGILQTQSFGMLWNGATWDRATAASGGLSIQDQAAFTAGASNFTPGGGVFNDAATLTSGQQGTFRMTTKRAQIMDVDSSGNQLHTDLTAPVAPCGATPCTNHIGAVEVASGGIAAGAQVDLLTMRGTKAAGTAAANSLLAGGVYNATPPTLTDGQQASLQLGPRGGILIGGAGYPAAATPITASATGTTGATTATLATGASVTTYLCGFSIRANATAAATANSTVTGTITGTLNYTQWTAPNTSGIGITEQIFTPCVPASAVNTGIAVISAAPGTGGVVSVTAWGFTL